MSMSEGSYQVTLITDNISIFVIYFPLAGCCYFCSKILWDADLVTTHAILEVSISSVSFAIGSSNDMTKEGYD